MKKITKVIFEKSSLQKLESNGVRTIKNRTLLAPGFWNGRDYSSEEIVKAFEKTDWNDKDVISLIADHNDDDNKGRPLTIRDWLGFVSNQHLDERGYLVADLNLCDNDLAVKLIDGKASFGISPFVYGNYDGHSQKDFIFKNFAVVVEPACKECYVNDYLDDDGMGEKLTEISAFERVRKRLGLSVSQFYAVPRDPPSESKLPIFDAAHVRNALARFNQTNFKDETEKNKAKSKIISAAKKFGITVSEKLNKTNFIELKGGLKNTSNMEKEKLEEEKVEEEIVEAVKEEIKEESKVEEPVEEVKEESEKVDEDEDNEKLLKKIAKMAEAFLAKNKKSPEQIKMDKLEQSISNILGKVEKLSADVQKLSESKVESKLDKEKLSAKHLTKESTKLKAQDSFSFCNTHKNDSGAREVASMLGY